MAYRIRISREWGCSPLGGEAVSFPAGEYEVPTEMSEFLARRCLNSGRGIIVQNDADEDEVPAPRKRPQRNKSLDKAPENKSARPRRLG